MRCGRKDGCRGSIFLRAEGISGKVKRRRDNPEYEKVEEYVYYKTRAPEVTREKSKADTTLALVVQPLTSPPSNYIRVFSDIHVSLLTQSMIFKGGCLYLRCWERKGSYSY